MRMLGALSVIGSVFALTACGGGVEEEEVIVAEAGVADEAPAAASISAPMPADGVAAPRTGEADVAEVPLEDAAPRAAAPAASATDSPAPRATRTTAAAPAARPALTPVAATAPTPPATFAVCGACHSIQPGEQGIGPTLAGVFGAPAANQPGFEYSQALEESGLTWTQAHLDRYLENPRAAVPGTTMAYPGVRNAAQRQAVIDYLKTL